MSERSANYPVLLISLAINLLFIGALTGEWLSGARRPPPPMEWATTDLDETTRAGIRRILEEKRPIAQSLRYELRSIDQRLMDVIRAPELDSATLSKTLSDLREANTEYQVLLHTSLATILPELTPPQRAAVLHRLLKSAPPGRRPHARPPVGDRPPAKR